MKALVELFSCEAPKSSEKLVIVQFLSKDANAWITYGAATADKGKVIEGLKRTLAGKGYEVRCKVRGS